MLFGPSPNTVPAVNHDYDSDTIVSTRDLQDWTRLWINFPFMQNMLINGQIQLGLKWTNVTSGTPGIKIVQATDSDGGTEYLQNATSAATQSGSAQGGMPVLHDVKTNNTNILPINGSAADFIFPSSVWVYLTAANPAAHFLFEGSSEGTGQLSIVLLDANGNALGQGPGVWLDLRNIKEMYQRVIATGAGSSGYNDPLPPYETNQSTFNDGALGTAPDADNYPFSAPYDETKQCVIYVHGYYTDYNGFVDYSETMFKRLWWQGYKGRFIGFNWPTLSGASSYNPGEWTAWEYGRAFMTYVNSIKPNFSPVTVAAHSMGNVVVGSAIQEGLSVDNYIMMEAALPTGCYSTASQVNSYQRFITADQASVTPNSAAALGYKGFISPEMGNVGNYYCFYNPLDFLLVTGTYLWGTVAANWEADQISYKPDGNPGQSADGIYSMNPGPTYSLSKNVIVVTPRPVTDAHESMSFVARPRSQAAGADPNDPFVFTHSYDLEALYGFGSQISDHSGQFKRDYDLVYPLYTTFESIIAPATQ